MEKTTICRGEIIDAIEAPLAKLISNARVASFLKIPKISSIPVKAGNPNQLTLTGARA